MRVALLVNFIPPYRVPLFRALAREVDALRIFVSTGMDPNRSWPVDWGGLDVVQQRTLSFNRTWFGPGFREPVQVHIPLDTRRQLSDFKPDVILSGELAARSTAAVRYARRARVPVVLWATLTERLEKDCGPLRRRLREWLLRRVDRVIVHGQGGVRYIRSFGYAADRIACIPQTTDLAPFLALPQEPVARAAHRFLFAGSLSPRKGVTLLLDALDRLSASDLELTVVGDGPLRTALERQVRDGYSVRWAGHVAYEELPRWFVGADCFVFPTLGDEWGLVVNEALAAGVPVLGSCYSQAVEELVRDGENGWVFTPHDAVSVAQAIERVLACDPARLQNMRAAARRSVAGLDPATIASRMTQVLREARLEFA